MMNVYFFLDACTNSGVLKVVLFIENLLKIILYIIPIILILMVMIDLSKAVLSSDESAMQKSLKIVSKRMLSVIILFLVPTISKFAVNLASDTAISDYTLCLTNTENISYYETLEAAKKKIEQEKNKEWYPSLGNDGNFVKRVLTLSKGKKVESSSSSGTYNGQTYNLSDSQLTYLTTVAICENDSESGVAAEASIMANLFELKGSSYGTGASGLVNYVSTPPPTGWFGCYSNDYTATPKYKDIVKKVLVLGQRSFPIYIDEHDCWFCNSKYCSNRNLGDICTVGGESSQSFITNRSNYVRDKTVISNIYGSTYTFYAFPDSNSDPFGYTQESYNKIKKSS